MQIKPQLSISY